jgi:hypothetical protein
MGNIAISDNILRAVLEKLADVLPPGWRLSETKSPTRGNLPRVDAAVKVRGPNGATGMILIEVKSNLEPKTVDSLKSRASNPDLPLLVVAPFISVRTQERLKSNGFAYADLTGNVRLSLSEPGLFIETNGAIVNPAPDSRARKSLKGAKAGRLIRVLCDFRPPIGLRELARKAEVDAGHVSRIVDYLDRESLLSREKRGPITTIDWPALIRRWAQDYSPFQPRRVSWYLAARGIDSLLSRFKSLSIRYAVSGSWAAAQYAPVSPTKLLLCYAEDIRALAESTDIRPADAGANIAVVTPFDSVIFERTSEKKGITVAAVSQIAVDLINSPGRGPSEGEALIEWMRHNEHVWRA